MIEANLITYVRSGLGKNTVAKGELDDTDIVQYSTDILKRIGDKITIKEMRYITGVISTRSYDVPATVLRVVRVYVWDYYAENYLSVGDLGASHRPGETYTNEGYMFPSTYTMDAMRKARALPRIRYEFDPINRKLRIDPMPTESGNKYWYLSVEKSKWTLALLPEDFEEIMIIGCVWKSLEQIALKRSELGGVMREGGRVTYPATELFAIAEKKKEQFDDLLNVKQMAYSRF